MLAEFLNFSKNLKNKLEKEYPNIKCLLSSENLGYAKGNNLGLSMVKTKYAFIINPDAEVENQTINNMFTKFADNGSIF